MSQSGSPSQRLLLVDDDAISCEVLNLLATAAGYQVHTAESGDLALDLLRSGLAIDIVLADLQMPGTCGAALAPLLRSACPAGTPILAMSASGDGDSAYDGFLRKPFDIANLTALLNGRTVPAPTPAPVLDETVFQNLAVMGTSQRQLLFTMCLDDAAHRIERMRQAAEARDNTTFVREAHALRGGCGIVGATELRQLASVMEETGLPPNFDPADISRSLHRFLAASDSLRRILDAHP